MIKNRPRVMKIMLWSIALPYIANTAGWLLTEVGRFPWVVYELVKLEESVSNTVSAGMVLTSLIGYALVYSALIVATLYLLQKYAKAGPERAPVVQSVEENWPSLIASQD